MTKNQLIKYLQEQIRTIVKESLEGKEASGVSIGRGIKKGIYEQGPPVEPEKTITPDQAEEIIRGLNGAEYFGVMFIKKDGTERVMNAQRGVTKHLAGGSLKYDPKAKGLITVYDPKAAGYRSINKNTLIWLKARGVKYNVQKKDAPSTNTTTHSDQTLKERPTPTPAPSKPLPQIDPGTAPTETPRRRITPKPGVRPRPKASTREGALSRVTNRFLNLKK